MAFVVDMTEQKRAEESREEHLWFLECMDRINRAMQRTHEVEAPPAKRRQSLSR
ncbi:hypothetical protein [Paraburkholderia panacisoli]|uniref:hypothetical protein n=1 Tax=Paraburkholderia panacisoli TaxID=2603818 RepID=UPI00165ED3B1|nr:hypothetical protein [Paraburkholderia panacisoli]